jgi:predicted lipid-binding transport protein (Tim44 family)
MRTTIYAIVAALALVMAIPDADAQSRRRFGGGGNIGKQRPAPMQQEAAKPPVATPGTPATAPNAAAPATAKAPAAGAAAAPAAKPSFMQRWGGLLAGLGIGALLASLFGAQMGPIIGLLLAMILVAVVVMLLIRFFAGRRGAASGPTPQYAGGPTQRSSTDFSADRPASTGAAFSGIGSAVGGSAAAAPPTEPGVAAAQAATIDPAALAPSEVEGFLRVAKTSFIRLQAANDAGDLDDIRDFTTPEMYAEIAMQLGERGGATQRNEVVSVDARLVEAVVEGDYAIASVRFTGLIRENDARNPEPFDEIWHVRKSLRERNGAWTIAGIQQVD